MPLRFDMEEWLGTNLDGSKSDTFCYYCLKDGKYTVDVSMHEMIDIWLKYVNKYNMYAHTVYSPEELKMILEKPSNYLIIFKTEPLKLITNTI